MDLREPEAWHAYLQNIREQKPRLPALLDELKQAGLKKYDNKPLSGESAQDNCS